MKFAFSKGTLPSDADTDPRQKCKISFMLSTMRQALISISALVFIVTALNGCYSDNAEELYPSKPNTNQCDTTAVTYSGTVSPIITTNCLDQGCHTAGHPDGGYSFDSHDNFILTIPDNRLLNAIGYKAGGSKNMPPSARMGDCEINKIKAWINKGAKND
jgi:hypothetical protein